MMRSFKIRKKLLWDGIFKVTYNEACRSRISFRHYHLSFMIYVINVDKQIPQVEC